MNWHVFERASTHVLAVVMVGGAGVAGVASTVEPVSLQEMFGILAALVVSIMGALAAVLVRWLNNAGKTLPRSESRLEQYMKEMRRDVTELDRRVSRIEGSMNSLVVVEGRR